MGIRVVVLASEQLMPAIGLLAHLLGRYGPALEAVCIVCSGHEQRSRQPALRLCRLLRALGAHDQPGSGGPRLRLGEGDGSMAAVRDALHGWFCEAPQARWIVDATGGTKPMSAAAVEYALAAGFVAERRVLYLELGGGWGAYGVDEASGLTRLDRPAPGDPDIPPADVLEREVPLGLLVQTQHAHRVSLRTRPLPATLDPAVQCAQASAARWRWQAPGIEGSGSAFECFIASGLLLAGLQRLAWSVEVLLEPGGAAEPPVAMAETDIVLCSGSTVCCIDIKLPGEHGTDAKSSQLTRALHNARQLGGRAVKTLVLRPGWRPDPAVQAVAAALGVVLLDQSHAACVFTELLRHAAPGLAVPAGLQQIEQALARQQAETGGTVLSTTATVHALEDEAIDFDATAAALMDHLARPWVLVRMAPQAYRLQVALGHPCWNAPPDRAALRRALLAVAQWRQGSSQPRALQVVRDDVAALVLELVLRRDELGRFSLAVDRACLAALPLPLLP